MRSRALLWVCGLCLTTALLALAQEGHPLTGTGLGTVVSRQPSAAISQW